MQKKKRTVSRESNGEIGQPPHSDEIQIFVRVEIAKQRLADIRECSKRKNQPVIKIGRQTGDRHSQENRWSCYADPDALHRLGQDVCVLVCFCYTLLEAAIRRYYVLCGQWPHAQRTSIQHPPACHPIFWPSNFDRYITHRVAGIFPLVLAPSIYFGGRSPVNSYVFLFMEFIIGSWPITRRWWRALASLATNTGHHTSRASIKWVCRNK